MAGKQDQTGAPQERAIGKVKTETYLQFYYANQTLKSLQGIYTDIRKQPDLSYLHKTDILNAIYEAEQKVIATTEASA